MTCLAVQEGHTQGQEQVEEGHRQGQELGQEEGADRTCLVAVHASGEGDRHEMEEFQI